MLDTRPRLLATDFPPLRRAALKVLQVNLGYRCNQQCRHCHVNAGPRRTEMMDDANIAGVLAFLARTQVPTLDLTGGAPELHPRFRHLVREARRLGTRVVDRCNLTVLLEPGQEDTAEFLASEGVEIHASLPCYLEANVDRQRGAGVFGRSIAALRRLNALGYGRGDGRLRDSAPRRRNRWRAPRIRHRILVPGRTRPRGRGYCSGRLRTGSSQNAAGTSSKTSRPSSFPRRET